MFLWKRQIKRDKAFDCEGSFSLKLNNPDSEQVVQHFFKGALHWNWKHSIAMSLPGDYNYIPHIPCEPFPFFFLSSAQRTGEPVPQHTLNKNHTLNWEVFCTCPCRTFQPCFTSRAWDTLALWHPASSPARSTCSTTFFCMADASLRQLDPPRCSLIAASRVAEHTAGSASTKTLQLARREATAFGVACYVLHHSNVSL